MRKIACTILTAALVGSMVIPSGLVKAENQTLKLNSTTNPIHTLSTRYDFSNMPYLQYGYTGQAVTDLQGYLCDVAAKYPACHCSTGIDGIFGLQTQSAVIVFQKWAGLTPDGKVGSQTWKALQNVLNNSPY